jgi:hypothetical protein
MGQNMDIHAGKRMPRAGREGRKTKRGKGGGGGVKVEKTGEIERGINTETHHTTFPSIDTFPQVGVT